MKPIRGLITLAAMLLVSSAAYAQEAVPFRIGKTLELEADHKIRPAMWLG
jgi:hypothetical protein